VAAFAQSRFISISATLEECRDQSRYCGCAEQLTERDARNEFGGDEAISAIFHIGSAAILSDACYLARRFVEHGWLIKKMHREIMLSATYALSSDYVEANFQADRDNKLLWRPNVAGWIWKRFEIHSYSLRKPRLENRWTRASSPRRSHIVTIPEKRRFQSSEPFAATFAPFNATRDCRSLFFQGGSRGMSGAQIAVERNLKNGRGTVVGNGRQCGTEHWTNYPPGRPQGQPRAFQN
jgi:hypothetical protein